MAGGVSRSNSVLNIKYMTGFHNTPLSNAETQLHPRTTWSL